MTDPLAEFVEGTVLEMIAYWKASPHFDPQRAVQAMGFKAVDREFTWADVYKIARCTYLEMNCLVSR